MGNLGDHFPEGIKEEFADRSLSLGTVVSVFVTSTTPPKVKRVIIVGIAQDKSYVGVVLINSIINEYKKKNQLLTYLQHPLKKEDNIFLEKDSHADCTNLHELDFSGLNKTIASDPKTVLGNVKEKDFERILSYLKGSKLIDKALRKKYRL